MVSRYIALPHPIEVLTYYECWRGEYGYVLKRIQVKKTASPGASRYCMTTSTAFSHTDAVPRGVGWESDMYSSVWFESLQMSLVLSATFEEALKGRIWITEPEYVAVQNSA